MILMRSPCWLQNSWRLICTLLLMACTCMVEAAPTSPLRFRALKALIPSDMSIVSLLQDRQGFIWIGTHNTGLYRYDGYQAVRYAHIPDNPASLPNDRVSTIFEDSKGRLWAGTQTGLARYNQVSNDFTQFAPQNGPNNHRLIKQIISDGAHGMWLATWGGLQHFNPDSGEFVNYVHDEHDPASLNSNDLNALTLDEHGGLWIATWPGGIDFLAPGSTTFRHFRIDSDTAPDAKLNLVRALYFDKKQRLWIGTERGAYRWNQGSPWETRSRVNSPQSRINGYYRDQSGAIWAGSAQAGLLRWDDQTDALVNYVHRADDQYSLPSADIRAVMQDRSGLLWVASFNAGISTVNLNSSGFMRLLPFEPTPLNRQPNNALQTIAGAPDGHLWIGGNGGLSLFDQRTGELLQNYHAATDLQSGMASNTVYSLYQAPGGPLWIGTAAGLHRLDRPDGKFHVTHFGNAASDFINTVVPGRNEMLWLGTGRNVIRLDSKSGKYQIYAHRDNDSGSLGLTGATCILEDKAGRVWIGSEWSSGLDMIDTRTGKVSHFFHDDARIDSLSDDKISAFHEDAHGRIWVGSAAGLNEIVTSASGDISFQRYASGQSVGPIKILSLQSDQAGKLWISTVTGLLALDPVSGMVNRYAASDGISDGLTAGVSYAAHDGTLYFGGIQGITAVHPEAVKSTATPPQVAITDISVGGRSLNEGPRPEGVVLKGAVAMPLALTLPAQHSNFSIEFASLYFNEPYQNRYAYRLVGYDRKWAQSDARHRNASYTNLDPGQYVFEVRSSNDQGIWSKEYAGFSLEILPPFWKTWWFRLLVLAIALSTVTVLYRLRVRALKLIQLRLEVQVLERTRELKDSNEKLAALSTSDGLTGITNRRGFDTKLQAEWERSLRNPGPLAIAMIDVDHFKLYNDRYGHQAGDSCLREVANVIADHARRASDLAARYGGEEFVMLLPACDAANALQLAQEICADLYGRALPHMGSSYGVVSVSIGVAVMVPAVGNRPDELIELADQALYAAKHQGRNRASLAGPPLVMAPLQLV